LFDVDERLQRLSDIGDQLEAFAAVVDFEVFRPELDADLGDGGRGGQTHGRGTRRICQRASQPPCHPRGLHLGMAQRHC
jgi:hypothetical protein